MNTEKNQADVLYVVDDSMSFDEIPKKTCRFTMGVNGGFRNNSSSPL